MTTPFTSKADFCQERDFGQKISATFEFVAAHARPLGKCLLYFVLPAAILMGMAQASIQYQTFRLIDTAGANSVLGWSKFSNFGGSYVVVIILSILVHSMLAATVYGYVRERIALPATEPVLPAQVWEQVKAHLLPLVLSSVVLGIVVGIGSLLFLVPGIYLGVVLSIAWAVQVLEHRSIGDLFSRCSALMQGKWWSTFGLLAVMYLIIIILSTIFSIPNSLLLAGKILHWTALNSPILSTTLALLTTTFTSFLTLLLMVAVMFQYFNLVERKEGHGLHSLIDGLGQHPAPVAHNQHFRPDDDGEY